MSLPAGPSQQASTQERWRTLKEFLYGTIQNPKFQQMTWKFYDTRNKRKYFVIYEFKDDPKEKKRRKTKLQKFGHIMEYVRIFKEVAAPQDLSEKELEKYQLELINQLKREDWCQLVERSERPNNLVVNKFEIKSTATLNVDEFRSLAPQEVDMVDQSYTIADALSVPLQWQDEATPMEVTSMDANDSNTTLTEASIQGEEQTPLRQLNQQPQSSSTESISHNSSTLSRSSELIQQFRQLSLTDSQLRKVRVKIAVDDHKVEDTIANLGEHGLQVYHGDRGGTLAVIRRHEPAMYRQLSEIGVNAIEIRQPFVCSRESGDALKHFMVGGLVVRYHPEDCSISLTRYSQVRVYCESHLMRGEKIERTCEATSGRDNVAKVFSFPERLASRSSDASIRIRIGSSRVKIEIIPFRTDAAHRQETSSSTLASSVYRDASIGLDRSRHAQETDWRYQSSYT